MSCRVAVVEAGPQRTAIRTPGEEGFIVSTKHFNHPEMVDIPIFEPPDLRMRYDTITRILKNRTGELNEELLK